MENWLLLHTFTWALDAFLCISSHHPPRQKPIKCYYSLDMSYSQKALVQKAWHADVAIRKAWDHEDAIWMRY